MYPLVARGQPSHLESYYYDSVHAIPCQTLQVYGNEASAQHRLAFSKHVGTKVLTLPYWRRDVVWGVWLLPETPFMMVVES